MSDPIVTHGIAALVGVFVGIVIALPWRDIVRRKVAADNLEEQARELRRAVAELNKPRPVYPPTAVELDPL